MSFDIKEQEKVKLHTLTPSEGEKLSNEIHRLIMFANDDFMLSMDRHAYLKVTGKIVGVIDRVVTEKK